MSQGVATTRLYTGVTTDVRRRVHEHNNTKRGAKYTRSRRPIEVVYTQNFPDRSSAQSAESKFKRLSRGKKRSDHIREHA